MRSELLESKRDERTTICVAQESNLKVRTDEADPSRHVAGHESQRWLCDRRRLPHMESARRTRQARLRADAEWLLNQRNRKQPRRGGRERQRCPRSCERRDRKENDRAKE